MSDYTPSTSIVRQVWHEGQYVRVRHEGGNTVVMPARLDGGVCDPDYYLSAGGWVVDYVGDERPGEPGHLRFEKEAGR